MLERRPQKEEKQQMIQMAEKAEGISSDRRSFLSGLLKGALAVGFLSLFGAVVAFIFPPERREFSSDRLRLRVASVSDFPIGQGKQVMFVGQPIWVLHLKGGFLALSAVCTHQGCIVSWDEKRQLLICPCHGGLFDANGNVVAGLPRQPLQRLRVEVVGAEVFVGSGEV